VLSRPCSCGVEGFGEFGSGSLVLQGESEVRIIQKVVLARLVNKLRKLSRHLLNLLLELLTLVVLSFLKQAFFYL